MREEDVHPLTLERYRYSCRVMRQPDAVTEPVLLVSGAFQDMRSFERLESGLLPAATVVTVDLPGSGGADALPREYGFDFLAEALRVALDELALPRVNVVGLSYGSSIAHELARRHPRRVSALALVGAAPRVPPWSRVLLRDVAAALRAGRFDDFGELVLETLTCRDPRVFIRRRQVTARILRGLAGGMTARTAAQYADGMERVLAVSGPLLSGAGVRARSLVVAGEHDPYCVPSAARELTTSLDGAVLALFRDCDHMLNIERPAELCDVLVRFFTRRPLHALEYCTVEGPQPAGTAADRACGPGGGVTASVPPPTAVEVGAARAR